jgi:hypothetical protein
MHPLIIGISLALGLVIIPLLADFRERARNRRHERQWLIKHGVRVEARIIQVRTVQDWQLSERWSRDSWTGEVKRERTWRTFYHITAHWVHPRTGRLHTASTRICSASAYKPVAGGTGVVWFDPHNPERSCLDLPDQGKELNYHAMKETTPFGKEVSHAKP